LEKTEKSTGESEIVEAITGKSRGKIGWGDRLMWQVGVAASIWVRKD
jgi:hypothetical protein